MGIIDNFAKRKYLQIINKQIAGDNRFKNILFQINKDSSLIFLGGIDLADNELSDYIKDLEDRVKQGIITKQDEEDGKCIYTLKLQRTDGLDGYLNIIPHTLGTSLALGVQKHILQNFNPRKRHSFRVSNKEKGIFVRELLIPEIERMQKIYDYVGLGNNSETANKSNTNKVFSEMLKTMPSGLNPKRGRIEYGKQHKTRKIKARAEVSISDVEIYRNRQIDDFDSSFAIVELELPDKYIEEYINKLNSPPKKNDDSKEKENDKTKEKEKVKAEEDKNDKSEKEKKQKHYTRKISANKEIDAFFEVCHLTPGKISLGVHINPASVDSIFGRWDLSMPSGEKNAKKAVRKELEELIETELMYELKQLGEIIDRNGQDR